MLIKLGIVRNNLWTEKQNIDVNNFIILYFKYHYSSFDYTHSRA